MKDTYAWLLGIGTGLFISLIYLFSCSQIGFALSSCIAILLAGVSIHVIFQFIFNPEKKVIYILSVSIGLAFEFAAASTTVLSTQHELPPSFEAFIMPYVSIFITTSLMIVFLIAWSFILHYSFLQTYSTLLKTHIASKIKQTNRVDH